MERNNNLNLARKWRPKNFDQIVGQQIPVKMLLNSLYLEKLFPVYLFAGQRGCGKTSSARIFGAAINCKNIHKFREDPKLNKVPCLECDSCKAMAAGNHPDFIEIDAASHTGVENVRQILESCAYMPILGKKKIYLIDEAHMLSKAAFNAFLKILEEPPASALFILATTEIQKFPATVLSRCFQIIFKAVNNENLKKHIKNICVKEEVEIEDQAIDILIQETEGSVRDAINMLERVRFSEAKVTTELILKVLGKVSETEILDLFELLIDKDPKKLLDKLNSKTFENVNSATLWNMLVETLRATLWVKFKTSVLPSYFNNQQRLKEIAAKISVNRLNAMFQLFWTQEDLFLRTPNKKILLETILLQVCQQVNIADLEDLLKGGQSISSSSPIQNINKQPEFRQQFHQPKFTQPPIAQPQPQLAQPRLVQPEQVQPRLVQPRLFQPEQAKPWTPQSQPKPEQSQLAQPQLAQQTQAQPQQISQRATSSDPNWQAFLNKLTSVDSQLLVSIISQAEFIKFDEERKLVEISLLNDNSFIRDTINENKKEWLPILKESYPGAINFGFIKKKHQIAPKPIIKLEKTFNVPVQTEQVIKAVPVKKITQQIKTTTPPPKPASPPPRAQNPYRSYARKPFAPKPVFNPPIDVSDKEKWPKANLIKDVFPGKVKRQLD